MPGLTVYLNREGLNTIETDTAEVHATESVDIVLENHGKPTHVHLHLDDDLAMMGTIEETNWFVPTDEFREVPLKFSDVADGSGRLEITTGYGQERAKVDVRVTPTDVEETSDTGGQTGGESATVDTRGEIEPARDAPLSFVNDLVDDEKLRNPTTVIAGLAVVLGLLVLLAIDPILAVAGAIFAVLSALAVASYLGDWNPLADANAEE